MPGCAEKTGKFGLRRAKLGQVGCPLGVFELCFTASVPGNKCELTSGVVADGGLLVQTVQLELLCIGTAVWE